MSKILLVLCVVNLFPIPMAFGYLGTEGILRKMLVNGADDRAFSSLAIRAIDCHPEMEVPPNNPTCMLDCVEDRNFANQLFLV